MNQAQKEWLEKVTSKEFVANLLDATESAARALEGSVSYKASSPVAAYVGDVLRHTTAVDQHGQTVSTARTLTRPSRSIPPSPVAGYVADLGRSHRKTAKAVKLPDSPVSPYIRDLMER